MTLAHEELAVEQRHLAVLVAEVIRRAHPEVSVEVLTAPSVTTPDKALWPAVRVRPVNDGRMYVHRSGRREFSSPIVIATFATGNGLRIDLLDLVDRATGVVKPELTKGLDGVRIRLTAPVKDRPAARKLGRAGSMVVQRWFAFVILSDLADADDNAD